MDTEKRLDDFVYPTISPSEKKPKVEIVNTESTPQNLLIRSKQAIQIYTGLKDDKEPESDENASEITEMQLNRTTQIVNASEEEIEVIETLEELENALCDVLAPTNHQVLTKKKMTIPFSLKLLENRNSLNNSVPKIVDEKRFLARINPDDAAAAEAELSRQISQADFEKVTSSYDARLIVFRCNSI